MEKFGFLLHPLQAADVARRFPLLGRISPRVLERCLRYLPPFRVAQIRGVASPYAAAEGVFVACPLTSAQMLALPEPYVLQKIVRAGKLAQRAGARILGLGAFTSVVGDAGVTVAHSLDIPVTTGNSYTVATAIEGAKLAAREMELDLREAHVVVLGATGSIGAACAQILAGETRYLTLAARSERKLEKVAEQIYRQSGLAVRISKRVRAALRQADLVIAVTSAVEGVIEADDLKSGAIVCDVARPRNVSQAVAAKRSDVLVVEGGVVEVPGDVDFGFDFGFPPRMAYACMAETMILALERRYESFTLGRQLTLRQIECMAALARKHGFKLAGLRSFERAVTREEVERIKENVRQARAGRLLCVKAP